MRKVLVALFVVVALALFAEHWAASEQGDFANATLEGSVTVWVHQWLDASLTTQDNHIYDYGEQGNMKFGTLHIDSNALVKVDIVFVAAYFNGQPINPADYEEYVSYEKFMLGEIEGTKEGYTYHFGEVGDGDYDLVAVNVEVNKDLPAGTYELEFNVVMNPTVEF